MEIGVEWKDCDKFINLHIMCEGGRTIPYVRSVPLGIVGK